MFGLGHPSPGVYRLYGRINGELQEALRQGGPSSAPIPAVSPSDPHLPRRPSNTSFGSVSGGVTAALLWVFVCSKFCLCPQRLESVFPQSSGKAIIESRWPSRPDSLGIPSPFVRSPGWDASCRVQNLHNSVRTSLALLFSSLWITHLVGLGFSFYRDHSPPILLL